MGDGGEEEASGGESRRREREKKRGGRGNKNTWGLMKWRPNEANRSHGGIRFKVKFS